MHSKQPVDNDPHPRLADSLRIETIAGTAEDPHGPLSLVLNPQAPSWAIMNADGLELLYECDGTRSVAAIAEVVARHKSMDPALVRSQVETFCRYLQEHLLLACPGGPVPRENVFQGVALEITKRCNLRCRHCYLAAGEVAGQELSTLEIKALLAAVRAAGGVSAAIGGGEPLLREDWLEIVQHALDCGLLVSLGTNATLVDERRAAQLAALPIKVQISLDGASREVHDSIRGEGSYAATVAAIDRLVRAGKARDLVVAFTPMRPNVHEVEAIVDFARVRLIPVVQFPPLTPSGRARERWSALLLDEDETLRFWDTVARRAEQLHGEMDLLADCLAMNIHQAGRPYQCTIGSQLRIDPEGNVYPCQCFHYGEEFSLGNLRNQSLAAMIAGEKLRDIKQLNRDRPAGIAVCSGCRWQKYCGGGCMGNAWETTGTALSAPACSTRKRWIEGQFDHQCGLSRAALHRAGSEV